MSECINYLKILYYLLRYLKNVKNRGGGIRVINCYKTTPIIILNPH